jgi:hypothetical protein
MLHKHHDGRQEAEAEGLAHMAFSNSHRFFRTLSRKIPEQYGVYDDSAGPSAEKCALFRDFFAELLAKLRGDGGGEPDEVVDKYAAHIPPTNAATHAMLTAIVTWQEVYALLYPAHRLALRPASCLPDCKLCPLFAEHVNAFKPGDTRMAPPEHRPRLWTSKAAGPDGVFAETLRWACPEAREERHAYRQSVCEAFASIFNAVIASGQVPLGPQFADSVMTALYKGDGDREEPTNYRGICVPNVLAKLFGLVLGTRLSHWAVANGVISPAQAGFVVLHGCEYHIFTLLETLRHRVRQGEDTVLVFLDFKKAYDSVSQPLAWAVLERMGIPSDFMTLLKTWTAQSRIALRMGGATLEPFPQETGVPQGGVLSPIIFNLFIEMLLRHVNAHAADLGVKLSAVEAERAGVPNLPHALQLLALAYADDVVLVCPSHEAAQQALRLVQEWALDFGMTVGVGRGKTEAMLVSAATVAKACSDDVNGMPKRSAVAAAPPAEDDPAPQELERDDDASTGLDDPDDEEWLPGDDPVIEERQPPKRPPLRKGQVYVNGEVRGAGTGKPCPYVPRPLPSLLSLPPLRIVTARPTDGDPVDVAIPWTSLYKYLGFMVRADLLDDHAYDRVEKKTKAAAERLFPHHRLVRAWPLGLKLQLLQSLILSVTANVLPLLTSMRCASETKTARLDKLWTKIARSTLRIGSARSAYVTAEAGVGDVMGGVVQHRLRLALSLGCHPLRTLAAPPIACLVRKIVYAESEVFRSGRGPGQHSLLLAPWPFVTARILRSMTGLGGVAWPVPELHREVAPFASAVARRGEHERWTARMKQDIDWMCDSFALRPPQGTRRQTAALHWTSRLDCSDAGSIPKLTPLSYRGPRGSSIVALARLRSRWTFVISSMRQGNASMQHFPFVGSARASAKAKGADADVSGVSWKTCRLCADGDTGPRYDLWHVLFECSKTCAIDEMVAVREACKAFVPTLCAAIEAAVERNGESMSDTRNAGVSHGDILGAADDVRAALVGYNWDCVPGQWLIYTLLLALPFPAKVVRPDTVSPVWLCPPKRKRHGAVPDRNLRGMPDDVPQLPDAQYSLPEAVGRLFDCTVLASDALRPSADLWCRLAMGNLLRAGAVVRPLRAAASQQPSAAAGVAATVPAVNDNASTSSGSSDESPPGSDAEP